MSNTLRAVTLTCAVFCGPLALGMIIGYWIDSITIGAVVERMNQKSEPDGLQYVWDAARYHYEWEGYDKEHCEICRRIFATTPIGGRLEIIEGNGSKQLIRDVKEKR